MTLRDYLLKLDENSAAADGIHLLTCSGLDDAFFQDYSPGQFAYIRVPNAPELLLRRPISIFRADPGKQSLTLAVQRMGKGTDKLCALPAGTDLSMTAPLGNGYPWPEPKRVWLVGGGVGVAPLMSLLVKYPAEYKAFLGFRDQTRIFALDEFQARSEVFLCTDNGSAGRHGFVTDALREELAKQPPDVLYACGPGPFVRALSKALAGFDGPCFVSLEERMGCGIGACHGCAVKIQDAVTGEPVYRRVCADGPVFLLSEVMI